MGGLRTEGATQFDPLQVYAANRGIAESDISKYFTFGNTAAAGNMPLFQQQTIGVPFIMAKPNRGPRDIVTDSISETAGQSVLDGLDAGFTIDDMAPG